MNVCNLDRYVVGFNVVLSRSENIMNDDTLPNIHIIEVILYGIPSNVDELMVISA